MKIKADNKVYIIVNVYAPTKDHRQEQLKFIKSVKEKLVLFENETMLIGGDFNFYLNPKLDKLDSMQNRNDSIEYRKEVISLLETLNLVDCFRVLPRSGHFYGKMESRRVPSFQFNPQNQGE